MKDLGSFKTKYPDVLKVNIEIFCLIFDAGMTAGIIKGRTEARIDTLDQRQLESLRAADEAKVKADWDKDPALRSVWMKNFEAYLAFVELGISDRIKVVSRKI